MCQINVMEQLLHCWFVIDFIVEVCKVDQAIFQRSKFFYCLFTLHLYIYIY